MSAAVDRLFLGSHHNEGDAEQIAHPDESMPNHHNDNNRNNGGDERRLHWFRVIIGVSSIVTPLLVAVFAFSAKMYVSSVYDERSKPVIERIEKLVSAEQHSKDLVSLATALKTLNEQAQKTDNRVDDLRTQVAFNYTDILVSLAELKVGIARLEGQNIAAKSNQQQQQRPNN